MLRVESRCMFLIECLRRNRFIKIKTYTGGMKEWTEEERMVENRRSAILNEASRFP